MDRPVARPPRPFSSSDPAATHAAARPLDASLKGKRTPRPGWRVAIVREKSFRQLQEIQKSTKEPVIDLSFLADACVSLALEHGADEIVKRAIASFHAARSAT